MMKALKSIVLALVISILVGCGSNQIRSGANSPSFIEGLAAIERKDFAAASYHFAELAKEGEPGSMNNLGVSLLMVNRKDEALYWFKKASRYGDPNAKLTLKAMDETVPLSDLVGQHPTQLQREAANKIIVATVLGIAVGVTTYYASQGTLNQYNYPINNGFGSRSTSSGSKVLISPARSWVGGISQMAPDGSYVGGIPRMAPDGSYVGGTPRMAPDGSYVGGTPRMAPDGSYVGGIPQMAPDGSYVDGTPRMAPDGSYVGGKP